MTWAAWIELFWTLMTLTPFVAAIYLLDRAIPKTRVRAVANDNMEPLPPIIRTWQ